MEAGGSVEEERVDRGGLQGAGDEGEEEGDRLG